MTWKAESKSPDGKWIAFAQTENTDGGFGTGAQWTTVQLRQSFDLAKPMDILIVDEGPESVKELRMNWPSSSHLDITYKGGEKVLFQAVIAFEQNITVEKLPD
ncbi:MAG: hypothetical protein ABI147_07970 [Acidobacteriaceae bacterium]